MSVGSGNVRATPVSADVDHRTVIDLLTGVSDLAAAVTAPGLGRTERMSRASRTAENARNVATFVRSLDPYSDGQHSRLRDMLHASGMRHWATGNGSASDAAERVAMADQRDRMRHELRAAGWADFTGAQHPGGVTAVEPLPSVAQWLNTYAQPVVADLGPATLVPNEWDSIPDGVIGAQTPIPDTAAASLDGDQLGWTVGKWGVNEARQLLDWTTLGAAELERLIAIVVDKAIEQALLVDLVDGAPAAATFEAAEVAVGAAWPPGADVILTSGEDAPKVRRAYAGENLDPTDRPRILPTAGATTGQAIVLASAAVHAEISTTQWLIADRPSEIGRDIVAYRYGRVRRRVAGAVQLVTVA